MFIHIPSGANLILNADHILKIESVRDQEKPEILIYILGASEPLRLAFEDLPKLTDYFRILKNTEGIEAKTIGFE